MRIAAHAPIAGLLAALRRSIRTAVPANIPSRRMLRPYIVHSTFGRAFAGALLSLPLPLRTLFLISARSVSRLSPFGPVEGCAG